MPRGSCLTNLLESFHDWLHSVDNGFGVDIIYLDYKKNLPVCLIVDWYVNLRDMVYQAIFCYG